MIAEMPQHSIHFLTGAKAAVLNTIKDNNMRKPHEERIFNTYRNVRQIIYNGRSADHNTWLRNGIPLEEDLGTFREFFDWVEHRLGPQPFSGARIVRKDQARGFLRRNLEWGRYQEQGDRLLRGHQIRYRGQTHCLKTWCRMLDLNYSRCVRLQAAGQLQLAQQVRAGKRANDAT